MTEEAREQSFARYLAAKKAVSAYGLSKKFAEEEGFEPVAASSTSRLANVTAVNLSDQYILVVPVGAGKTQFFMGALDRLVFQMLPQARVTSEFTIAQGDSMATQEASIADEQSVEEIILGVRTGLTLAYGVRLASRLSELQKAVEQEDLEGHGISVTSLEHFIKFLEANPALRCPAISVTPDRNIYASWRSGSERLFSVHFLPSGETRFVIFRPNPKHPRQTLRLSGTATVDVLMSIIPPHGVLSWACNERPSSTGF